MSCRYCDTPLGDWPPYERDGELFCSWTCADIEAEQRCPFCGQRDEDCDCYLDDDFDDFEDDVCVHGRGFDVECTDCEDGPDA